jgi:hypothetical protein
MLAIEIRELDRVALKVEMGSGVGDWGKQWGAAVFVTLVFVWIYFFFVEEGVCVRDCKGLGFCKVHIVGCSVGDECEGGRCSLVTGWGERKGQVRAGEESG